MTLQTGLTSPNPQIRARSYFDLCLIASQVADFDVEKVAAAYREISAGLIAGEADGPASGPKFRSPEALQAWALVYGYRTFEIAFRLLPERMSGRWTEVGAGIGPIALLAAARGAEAVALEPSKDHVAFGRRMAAAGGLDVVYEQGLSRAAIEGTVVYPYSLREIGRRLPPRKVAKQLRAQAELGRVWIIEVGTQSSSTWLATLRDELDDLVAAPCPARGPCPMVGSKDWCHFTWPVDYPPQTRQIFDLSKRRHQEAHFSYLHLASGHSEKKGHRVLSSRAAGKGKWRLDLCSQAGEPSALLALNRDKHTYDSVVACRPNDLVLWPSDGVQQKGDGLRLNPGQVAAVVPRET